MISKKKQKKVNTYEKKEKEKKCEEANHPNLLTEILMASHEHISSVCFS